MEVESLYLQMYSIKQTNLTLKIRAANGAEVHLLLLVALLPHVSNEELPTPASASHVTPPRPQLLFVLSGHTRMHRILYRK
jgi:hypothetical protein